MKILIFSLMIFCHISLMAQNGKLNVAILDLDPTNIEVDDAKFLSDRLRIELFDGGAFNVVERDKMNTILQEQGFQISGCSSLECAVEIGQLLNVQQMIAGSIGRIENVYSITLRLINVETGAIIKTAKRDFRGSLSEMLTEVIPEIAEELSDIEKKDPQQGSMLQASTSRWGGQLRFGLASHTFIADFNTAIDDFNAAADFSAMDEVSQFRNFGLEIIWDRNSDWRFNFGVEVSTLANEWVYENDGAIVVNAVSYSNLSITRNFTLSYIYTGVDYKIPLGDSFRMYLGSDLGFSSMVSKSERQVARADITQDPEEDSFSYVSLALKLKIGVEYIVSENLELSLEFAPLIQTEYNTEEEFNGTGPFQSFRDAVYPDTMDGAGIILTLAGSYYLD